MRMFLMCNDIKNELIPMQFQGNVFNDLVHLSYNIYHIYKDF